MDTAHEEQKEATESCNIENASDAHNIRKMLPSHRPRRKRHDETSINAASKDLRRSKSLTAIQKLDWGLKSIQRDEGKGAEVTWMTNSLVRIKFLLETFEDVLEVEQGEKERIKSSRRTELYSLLLILSKKKELMCQELISLLHDDH